MEVCPASGCPGPNPKTRLRPCRGTEAERAVFALEHGQPVQWFWLLALTTWEQLVQEGELSADTEPLAIPDIEPDSTVVSFICDRGDRYMDTVYSDEWVKKHFGDVKF